MIRRAVPRRFTDLIVIAPVVREIARDRERSLIHLFDTRNDPTDLDPSKAYTVVSSFLTSTPDGPLAPPFTFSPEGEGALSQSHQRQCRPRQHTCTCLSPDGLDSSPPAVASSARSAQHGKL